MRNVSILLLFAGTLLTSNSLGQYIESVERSMEESYGKQKLMLLHQLAEYYIHRDAKKAVRFAKQSEELADNIIRPTNTLISKTDYYLKPKSSMLLGKAYFEREQYLEAKQSFAKAKENAKSIGYKEFDLEIEEYLARLEVIAQQDAKAVEGNFLKKKLGNLGIGDLISETADDVTIATSLKRAEEEEKAGNIQKAIDEYQHVINLLRNKGDSRKITELREHIGDLYVKQGSYDEALNYYALVRQDRSQMDDSVGLASARRKIESTVNLKDAKNTIPQKVEENLRASSMNVNYRIDSLNLSQSKTKQELINIAEKLEQEKDYKKSLEYYKLYTELQQKYGEEEKAKELALLEQEQISQELKLLKQDQELNNLRMAQSEANLERQKKFRNNLIIGSILLIGLAMTLYLLYKNKKKDHRKLKEAYDALDLVKSQLEKAEKRIKTLLHQRVSGAVAQELIKEEFTNKIEERFVCIMFLDIRGFTPFVEAKKPEEIIQYQNDVFGFMIDIVEKHRGVINQLLGDGFMATFGAPVSKGNDCENAVAAAMEIVSTLDSKTKKKEIQETRIGIGLHAGNVVTGNVGTEGRKQYSITGNTVIIAARIEQLTKDLGAQVLISKDVYQNLNGSRPNEEKFKEMYIKGRNEPIDVMVLA